jgi:hypothetical protein
VEKKKLRSAARIFGVRHWLYSTLTILFIFTSNCSFTDAQTAGNGERMSKVTPELVALYDQYSAYVASHGAGAFRPADPLVRGIDDRAVVDAVASGDAEVLKSDLVSLGMRNAVAFGRVVSGELPISAIPALNALPSLQFARAAALSTRGEPHPGR